MEIKISQESLDAFKKEKTLMPAPIDNKNVMQDWIEEIFDYQTCVWGEKNCAVGFIHEQPVFAAWTNNHLTWKFTEVRLLDDDGCDHLAVLKDRLNDAHDPDGDLVETFRVARNVLWQSFYWKNED